MVSRYIQTSLITRTHGKQFIREKRGRKTRTFTEKSVSQNAAATTEFPQILLCQIGRRCQRLAGVLQEAPLRALGPHT